MASDPVIRGLFRALVARVGGMDAAAAVLAARYGAASKGSVSKMCAGSLGVTIEAVLALEDAIGEAPVTHYLSDRLGSGALPLSVASITQMTVHAALAAAGAQMALARALDEAGDGGIEVTPREVAEIGAAMAQLRQVADEGLAALERQGSGAVAARRGPLEVKAAQFHKGGRA